MWKLVEDADRREIESFMEHGVFGLDPKRKAEVNNIIDAAWVRRWKSRSESLSKSRLCGRGFLDRQKSHIDRHSSTASRLSHKLALSQAIQHNLSIEAFDIGTAFLQGLKFSEVAERARALGHEVKELRKVWLSPPANVWRHLRENPKSNISVAECDVCYFVLRLLKAMYGLVDGPLLFQLALLEFPVTKGMLTRSLHDENYLYLSRAWRLICIVVVHVDDLLVCAELPFLRWLHRVLEERFGKLKRNTMPFTYLGVMHCMLGPGHLMLHQDDYLNKLENDKLLI